MMKWIIIAGMGVMMLAFFAVPNVVFAGPCSCESSATSVCSTCPSDMPFCLNGHCVEIVNPVTTAGPTDKEITSPGGTGTLANFVCKIIGFFNKDILPVIAVFMTLLSGFYFMLSGQDPQKANTAKRILLYTVIGVALFLVAPAIISLISEVLGASIVFSAEACPAMGSNTITDALIKIVNWFAWFVALASVAMGLYAGFLYLTSRGMPQKVQQATKALSYVIVGIAVSVVAFSIVNVVRTFLG